jgi:integrase
MRNTRSSRSNRIDWLAKGPFAPHVSAYRQYLTERGYAANTVSNCMRSVAHFAQWARILRHTTAMHLLQSGVPFNIIALWLGHESPNTTHQYVEADLAMKEKALSRLQSPDTKLQQYHAPDSLMKFLQTL